jgi:hypothetical protein
LTLGDVGLGSEQGNFANPLLLTGPLRGMKMTLQGLVTPASRLLFGSAPRRGDNFSMPDEILYPAAPVIIDRTLRQIGRE